MDQKDRRLSSGRSFRITSRSESSCRLLRSPGIGRFFSPHSACRMKFSASRPNPGVEEARARIGVTGQSPKTRAASVISCISYTGTRTQMSRVRHGRSGTCCVTAWLKENVDGEALQWAAERLNARVEPNKVILMISDGAPVDDSTLLANGPNILIEHLKSVIRNVTEDQSFYSWCRRNRLRCFRLLRPLYKLEDNR